jgi:hypothetical protein
MPKPPQKPTGVESPVFAHTHAGIGDAWGIIEG